MSGIIAQALRVAGKQDTDTTVMEVRSINRQNGTCVCYDGELEHYDVRLSAIIDEKKQKFYVFPKRGSTVLVTPIDADYNMQFVSAVAEAEELFFCAGNTEFRINQEGFLLKKEQETLKQLMLDLISAIKAMKFTTNMGPTIKLINEAQFTAVENRFKQFLKEE